MQTEVNIDGMMLQGVQLTEDGKYSELNRFNTQYNDMFLTKYNPLNDLYAKNLPAVKAAAQVAKAKLGNIMFGGGRADSTELTMDFIRPGHIMRTTSTTETAENTWDFTYTAGSDQFLGYGTGYATSSKVDQDALIVIFGWANESIDNEINAIQLTVGNNDRPYRAFDMVNLADADLGYILPTPVEILMPKVSFSGLAHVKNPGVQRLRPIGITFSTGEFSRNNTYGAVNK